MLTQKTLKTEDCFDQDIACLRNALICQVSKKAIGKLMPFLFLWQRPNENMEIFI